MYPSTEVIGEGPHISINISSRCAVDLEFELGNIAWHSLLNWQASQNDNCLLFQENSWDTLPTWDKTCTLGWLSLLCQSVKVDTLFCNSTVLQTTLKEVHTKLLHFKVAVEADNLADPRSIAVFEQVEI